MRASLQPCLCGHQQEAHSHYRRGTDCAICAAGACVRYRIDKAPAARVHDALPVEVEVALAANQ